MENTTKSENIEIISGHAQVEQSRGELARMLRETREEVSRIKINALEAENSRRAEEEQKRAER